ncbi:MAG TPA: bacillithiol biosynthesis BshC, partial [Dongiaceae bacterium]|nr:bacillithiol biosynthesis BshC [Dongiaceae bacterium]
MSRELRVRDRVVPRSEPPYERLFDPLVDDLVRGGELSRERFAARWSDTAALGDLVAAKRRPLPEALARDMRAWHEARGASPASLVSLQMLARGEAVCVVAGQQPAPLGGPLYALHKIACAVGLAAAVRARTGVPCVPLFWMHGEDSDF